MSGGRDSAASRLLIREKQTRDHLVADYRLVPLTEVGLTHPRKHIHGLGGD